MKAKFKLSPFTLICLILYIISFVLIIPNTLFANYIKETSVEDDAEIADFVFVVSESSGSFSANLSESISKPGDLATYNFVVKNHDDLTTEVVYEYVIKLEIFGNMPIECTLLKNGDKQFVISSISQTSNTCSGSMGIEQIEVGFSISVSWPNNLIDESYIQQDAISVLVLTITASQID